MNLLTLTEIRRATQNGATSARVHVQVENATPKLTREQQPYCELTLADACDRMTLRVWSDHPAYKTCSALTNQDFIELTAEFFQSQYGLDARKWTVRPLTEQEKNELLQGPAANGATGSGAPRPRAIIITPGVADWSSTQRK
jgi:hypothetical protein